MLAVTPLLILMLAQQSPTPSPFPRAQRSSPPASPAAQPTPPVAQPAAPPTPAASAPNQPSETTLGVPLYPGAQFLASYDAGRGQQFFLFGSSASFVDAVNFYRNVLKQRGELIFDAPATHQFDVGRFREDTMAFPPGVTVKDFQSQVSQGYPNPQAGGQPAWFPTVIQIVSPAPAAK